MDSHLLFELTYVFYRICSTIINGERRLVESSGKFYLFYPPCEGWPRNLTQCLFHNISSHSFARRASAFSPVIALFIIGEGFAWWSSWPLSVNSVLFIIGREIEAGRGSPLLCSMELLLQVINLSLHGFIIISLVGDVASLRKWLPLVWVVCTLPSWYFSRSLSRSRLRKSSCWWRFADSTWCGLVWCGANPTILNRYTY